jgi:hypothetical protein
MRDEITAKLMERHEAKLEAKQAGRRLPSEDELAEDAEAERPNGTDTVR